jgi:GNAT superfamily N-acetyltransferase
VAPTSVDLAPRRFVLTVWRVTGARFGQSEPVTTASRVRQARPEEAETIADVWLRSRHASVPAIPPPVHSDDDVRTHFAIVVLPLREVWVVEMRRRVVGFLVLDNDWVDQLYVDPDWTGRGFGSQLIAVAKSRHPSGLNLWTFQSNVKARQFYERHGFVAVEVTDGDNEEGAPDVRYRWSST